MRISIKQLRDRIDTINGLTNHKYNIRLYETTKCGVDISINDEYQAEKNNLKRLFTNKEAMELLNNTFGLEVRKIIKEMNKI